MARICLEDKNATPEMVEMMNAVKMKYEGKTNAQILEILLRREFEDRPTMRSATHDKIHEIVTKQMAINASTDKVITVGVGKLTKEVKNEQRTITGKWIMENAGATFNACNEYLAQHQDEIAKHHATVLGLTDPKDIQNFNRSTGKAYRVVHPKKKED